MDRLEQAKEWQQMAAVESSWARLSAAPEKPRITWQVMSAAMYERARKLLGIEP